MVTHDNPDKPDNTCHIVFRIYDNPDNPDNPPYRSSSVGSEHDARGNNPNNLIITLIAFINMITVSPNNPGNHIITLI